MRISDWSSDVCSSDLRGVAGPAAGERDDQVVALDPEMGEDDDGAQERGPQLRDDDATVELERRGAVDLRGAENGRAQGRERECEEVYIEVGAERMNKKLTRVVAGSNNRNDIVR